MEKIPFNITSEVKEQKAFIRITGEIGWDTDAELLRPIVDNAIKQGATGAHLYLFGPGGSCFHANEMVNILSVFNGNLTGEGGALVASAYTYIALHCSTFYMPANGMFMVHPASGGVYGGVKKIEAYLKAIKAVEADYYNTYLEKAIRPEVFKANWEKGDWWMTAAEAKEQGFITGIIEKIKPDKELTALISACGCPKELIPTNDNSNNMTDYKPIARALGIQEDAPESDILATIGKLTKLSGNLQSVTTERDTLKAKIEAYEKAEKEKLAAEAKELLKAAFRDGRLDNDKEGKVETVWLAMFEKDNEGTKTMLASLAKHESFAQRNRENNDFTGDAFSARQREIENKNKR